MKRVILILSLLLLSTIPSWAVFNEKDLTQTLQVLRYELCKTYSDMEKNQMHFMKSDETQHDELMSLMKSCNELSLMLYSQKQNFTFDVTYALQQVTNQYNAFTAKRMPYDEIVSYMNVEIERYERLVKSLRRLPPEMGFTPDSLTIEYLDSLAKSLCGPKTQTVSYWEEELVETRVAVKPSATKKVTITKPQIKDSSSRWRRNDTSKRYRRPDSSHRGMDSAHRRFDTTRRRLDTSLLSTVVNSASAADSFSRDSMRPHRPRRHPSDSGQAVAEDEGVAQTPDSITTTRVKRTWKEHTTFTLDSLSNENRDSCLFYATQILSMLIEARSFIIKDNENYETTSASLKEFFDYAQERYGIVQRKILIDGQDNYWKVLTNIKQYSKRAFADMSDKYSRAYFTDVKSEWRGPMVLGFTLIVIVFLLVALLISFILQKVLTSRLKFLQTLEYKNRGLALILVVSLIIFIVTLSITRYYAVEANFFRMASSLLNEYLILLVVILSSMLFRLTSSEVNKGMKLLFPISLLGLIVITFRIIFIPNSFVTLAFPPILLIFCIWQVLMLKNNTSESQRIDRSLATVSMVISFIVLGMSLAGYVLLSLQVFIWWIFQLATLNLVIACSDFLQKYRRNRLDPKIKAYKESHKNFDTKKKEALVTETWGYDLMDMVVIPVLYVFSVPASLYLATNVFDLTTLCMRLFTSSFIATPYLDVSLYKIVLVVSLFFVFSYVAYAGRGFFRSYKFRKAMTKTGTDYIHENEVNLTLSNNVIGIIVWGIFAVVSIQIMKIPTKSLSMIGTGLAAGLGFAMKDILNNFFYGVQLMSGRLRVGDYIECDGIRGKVDNINYQSTQIIAIDGAVMEFPNSSLFNKNFKNLTRNHSYEFLALPVGVAYGANVDEVRKIIQEALKPLCKKDKFGREMIDVKYGVRVSLSDFGSSSVDLMVKQFVLVEAKALYIEMANEAIYNALNENNIEIPFPQADIHVKDFPIEMKK